MNYSSSQKTNTSLFHDGLSFFLDFIIFPLLEIVAWIFTTVGSLFVSIVSVIARTVRDDLFLNVPRGFFNSYDSGRLGVNNLLWDVRYGFFVYAFVCILIYVWTYEDRNIIADNQLVMIRDIYSFVKRLMSNETVTRISSSRFDDDDVSNDPDFNYEEFVLDHGGELSSLESGEELAIVRNYKNILRPRQSKASQIKPRQNPLLDNESPYEFTQALESNRMLTKGWLALLQSIFADNVEDEGDISNENDDDDDNIDDDDDDDNDEDDDDDLS
jgi:hypothetical protein